jgi:hypothetical protein
MMALHGSNAPDDTRHYLDPRNPVLRKTDETFLTEALDSSGTNVAEVDVPVMKVDEEVVHYNIRNATALRFAVLYKVFGKIH